MITLSEQNTAMDDYLLKCKEKEQEDRLAYLIENCEDFILEDD